MYNGFVPLEIHCYDQKLIKKIFRNKEKQKTPEIYLYKRYPFLRNDFWIIQCCKNVIHIFRIDNHGKFLS